MKSRLFNALCYINIAIQKSELGYNLQRDEGLDAKLILPVPSFYFEFILNTSYCGSLVRLKVVLCDGFYSIFYHGFFYLCKGPNVK